MKNSKKTAWILPTVLILLICEILTLPLVLFFTYADRSDSPDHLLVYTTGSLTWSSGENILPDGSAEFGLFSDKYDNVKSDNGDKVVAPGTDDYSIVRLRNDADATVSYVATLYMIKNDETIPVSAQLSCEGSEHSDKNVLPAGVPESAVVTSVKGQLATGGIADFDTSWLWKFYESDAQDQIDTYLGNLAAEGKTENVKIGLYIVVEDGTEEYPPAPPTGDALGTWFIFAGFTAVVFVVLIRINKRAKKKDRQ